MSRRAVIRVALFLLLGAIVNVAVAWAVCLLPPGSRWQYPPASTVDLARLRELGWPHTLKWLEVLEVRRLTKPGIDYQEFVETDWPLDASQSTGGYYIAKGPIWLFARFIESGWPASSLRGEQWDDRISSRTAFKESSGFQYINGWGTFGIFGEHAKERFAIDISSKVKVPGGFDRCLLPLRPLWPGFAIDTLFYVALSWLLLCGPFALRRTIRRRRGLCIACGYPIGSSPVCTECGRAYSL